jgi:hypothetical protein
MGSSVVPERILEGAAIARGHSPIGTDERDLTLDL